MRTRLGTGLESTIGFEIGSKMRKYEKELEQELGEKCDRNKGNKL